MVQGCSHLARNAAAGLTGEKAPPAILRDEAPSDPTTAPLVNGNAKETAWPRLSQVVALVAESKCEAQGSVVIGYPYTDWLSREMSQDQGRVETEGHADYHIGKYSFRGCSLQAMNP
jgi:hypothetical protein